MNTFQIILIVAIVFLFSLYMIYFKNRLVIRLLMMVIFSSGLILTISPNISSKIANQLGIGRGVDLIFYISIVFGLLGFIVLYSKYRKMEIMLTELIRKETIRTASEPEDRK